MFNEISISSFSKHIEEIQKKYSDAKVLGIGTLCFIGKPCFAIYLDNKGVKVTVRIPCWEER